MDSSKIDLFEMVKKTPKIKLWLNVEHSTDVITGKGVLWIVDFKKGVAERPRKNFEKMLDAPYPQKTTSIKSIIEFLTVAFSDSGLILELEVQDGQDDIVNFSPPGGDIEN